MPARRNDPETTREEAVNTLLARMLVAHGVSARAERRSRREGIPDIRVRLRTGDSIIMECKWEGSSGILKEQMLERLNAFPEALGILGVLYPDRLRHLENTNEELESATDLQWWLHGSYGEAVSSPQIRTGSAAELADHLRTLPLELEGVDRVSAAAMAIGYALEQSAQQIGKHARIARLIADVIANTDQEKNRAAALRIACLVLFNALAFQDRLSSANENVPTVKEALTQEIPGLLKAWRYICDSIDYVPVFQLAAEILDILGKGPEDIQDPVIRPLVKATKETRRLEGHDLSGRLFHTLLTDAKFTGAYYTSVPAATLLSRLVFHNWPPQVDWSDHEFPASLNVADLACGTGTLLMAVATEVERRHEEAGGQNAAQLHKAMVEQALHGYDVQLSAIHFAATSLAMLNPDIQFDRMNLYVMPLGVEGGKISLGSLDFLGENQVAVQFAMSGEGTAIATGGAERVSGGGGRGAEEGETATLPGLDLAIMNPPFTRSVIGNLLFGSLPSADRRKLQDELSRRLKPTKGRERRATATAELGAAFVAAASPKLRPGEGRLALVLPLTLCTGPSWQQTRRYIESDFALHMIITSHDPLRWNFSDSTDLSEALLIAARRSDEKDASEHRTTFVNLWQNPNGVLDAHRMAQAIAITTPAKLEDTGTALLEVDGRHVGEVLSITESKLLGKKWSGVQFARADLTRSALKLLEDGEVWVPGEVATARVPLCQLGDLGQIGPDVRDVRDGFEPTDAVTAYPMVEGHETEQRKFMVTKPDKFLAPLVKPRPGRRLKPLEQLWSKSGRLVVGARFRLNTVRVVALRVKTNVLGSMWWPIRVEDPKFEKALTLWLNSSLGLINLLVVRNTTQGAWVQLKKADLQELPVLDLRAITPAQLQALSELFDSLTEAEFERLPAMALCPARQSLDDGLS